MNIPSFAIENRQITLLGFLLLLMLGLQSYFSMPQLEDPVVEVPNILAVAIYPGASPEDVEGQVVDVIEEAVNEVDDLKELSTVIQDGVSVTEIEFIHGVDPKEKLDEVQRKINEVRDQLPPDLYDLDVIEITTSTVAIYQFALVSGTASFVAMEAEAEKLKKSIEDLNGVRKVEILAYPEREVRVALNPLKMSEMQVSVDAIEQAIQSNNANIPGGAVKVSGKLYNLKTSGSYDDLEQISNSVVGVHQGKVVYLKDVAAVFFDYADERWQARYNGARSLFITVQQKEGVNIFDIAQPANQLIEAWSLPESMEIAYVFDQADGISERVSGFINNLLQGILLVGLVILLVLGYRSAGMVMLAIPLSILVGLWVVDQAGFALQQISIAGLVVALGLLVDNSIAITENIERFLGQGHSPQQAAIKGTQQLIAPLASATLTTILAFIPILLIPDTTGEFIRSLPVTVVATLTASFLVAILLTPLIASRFLKGGEKKQSTRVHGWLQRFVEGPYQNTLGWALRNRWWVVGLSVLSLVGALALFPLVGISFFPKAEKPQFRIEVQLPNGSNLDATDVAIRHVESVLEEYDIIDYYASNVGHGNPRIYYNVASRNYSNSYGEVLVVLKEYNISSFYDLLDELRNRFVDYPNARINVKEFVQGPPSEAPIAIKIFGDDLPTLERLSREMEEIMTKHPGAINVQNPLATVSTDLRVHINRDKALMLGVPVYQIDKTIRTFVNGQPVGVLRDGKGEEYDIVLRSEAGNRFSIEDLESLKVSSMTGRSIPLMQLASVDFEEAPSQIAHLNKQRVATVLADLGKDYTLDEVVGDLVESFDAMSWPENYTYTFKGDLENRNESFGGMGMASLTALILILAVLVVQFKSFGQPLIIFSALPLAIIGSVLALLFTGIQFSFTAFVGFTSLIGIAINNSIVLVDFANRMRDEGTSIVEAAAAAGKVRFVPILMTTLTTILGLLPLTLNGGSLWAPMGWTIIGGLLTSTAFVLILVPVLYVLFTRDSGPGEKSESV